MLMLDVIGIAKRNQQMDIQEASQSDPFVLAQPVDEFVCHDYSWPTRQQGYTIRPFFQLGCETLAEQRF
jgi:hypothetical protein